MNYSSIDNFYIDQSNKKKQTMSIPQPPDGIDSHCFDLFSLFILDLETRNIIEKLASFVARMFERISVELRNFLS